MKIAFITYEYPPFIRGGAGVYAEHITEELVKQGHELTVFTPGFSKTTNEIPKEKIEIIRIKVNQILPFKALQFWMKLSKHVKIAENKIKFDIIYINGNSYYPFKTKITKAPQVVMIHHSVRDTLETNKKNLFSRFINLGEEDGFLMPMIEKKVIYSAQKIVVPSLFTKDRILNHYKIDSSVITVIYEGITFKNYSKVDVLENMHNWADKKIILFVGRVDDHRKGLDLLLKIFKRVLLEFDSRLLVVGSGNPKNIIYLAKSLGILDKVFFAGKVDDNVPHQNYNLCDVYACPSRLEGYGLTLL